MASLKGKVVALTGAASGIGLATVRQLVRSGAKVSVGDLGQDRLDAVVREIEGQGGEILAMQCDVGKLDDVENWVKATVERFGTLNGAVNLAAVSGKYIGARPVVDTEDEDWENVLHVNVTGTMYCMRAQLRVMADGGSIVNISSIAGLMGLANAAPYSTSKHAVIGLTRSAAKEVGRTRNIRCNVVAPGTTETPMLQQSRAKAGPQGTLTKGDNYSHVSLNRVGKAEEIAEMICFLLGDESSFVSGQVHQVDGGWLC